MQEMFSQIRFLKKIGAGVVLFMLLAGCATSGGKPAYQVNSYLLHYPTPTWDNPAKLAVSVKVNRFSIAAAYNSTNMAFRSDPFSLDAFNYSRWAVNPADMIADSLLANMRGSGLFSAVFSRHETDECRFVVLGGVEEFYLRADQKEKKAVVGISISLQDMREKEIGRRMMLQKKYFREETLADVSPRGYCQAASRAMESVTREIIDDIYKAVKIRVQ